MRSGECGRRLHACASKDETHDNAVREVLPSEAWRQGREVLYGFAAVWGTAEAFHCEGGFLHCRGVVVADFLALAYRTEGCQLAVHFDAGIGVAGVVDPDSRRLSINV
jgi:hypothetical protein